jgi:hypothetical protein
MDCPIATDFNAVSRAISHVNAELEISDGF